MNETNFTYRLKKIKGKVLSLSYSDNIFYNKRVYLLKNKILKSRIKFSRENEELLLLWENELNSILLFETPINRV